MFKPKCMRQMVAVFVSYWLMIESGVAQQSQQPQQPDLGLRVLVIQGNGAQNVVLRNLPVPLAVRVVDRENHPVVRAVVEFTAPESGPSGDFANASNAISLLTDEDGIAIAEPIHANQIEGLYQIQIQASFLGETANTYARITNTGRKMSFGNKIVILYRAGGAARASSAARGRGGGSTSGSSNSTPPSPTAPTITFGGSSVGGTR